MEMVCMYFAAGSTLYKLFKASDQTNYSIEAFLHFISIISCCLHVSHTNYFETDLSIHVDCPGTIQNVTFIWSI